MRARSGLLQAIGHNSSYRNSESREARRECIVVKHGESMSGASWKLVRECAAQSAASGEVYRIRLGSTAARPSAEVLGEWLRQGSAPKN